MKLLKTISFCVQKADYREGGYFIYLYKITPPHVAGDTLIRGSPVCHRIFV